MLEIFVKSFPGEDFPTKPDFRLSKLKSFHERFVKLSAVWFPMAEEGAAPTSPRRERPRWWNYNTRSLSDNIISLTIFHYLPVFVIHKKYTTRERRKSWLYASEDVKEVFNSEALISGR